MNGTPLPKKQLLWSAWDTLSLSLELLSLLMALLVVADEVFYEWRYAHRGADLGLGFGVIALFMVGTPTGFVIFAASMIIQATRGRWHRWLTVACGFLYGLFAALWALVFFAVIASYH